MHPELFEIPLLGLPIRGFGVMMACGFLMGILLVRRLTRRAGLDVDIIMNAALYSLMIGIVGARLFFVLHRLDQYRGDFFGAIAVWRGGLEFVGGVIPAIVVLIFYLRRHKLPVRRYMDIMAMGLMMGLAFGRIGCFLNGCCFGRPSELPWAVRFPYGSFAYISQINPDPARGRTQPYIELPEEEYFSFYDEHGYWYPIPLGEMTEGQRHDVTEGKYRCLAVHPTQLYSSINALLICGILYVFWRRSLRKTGKGGARGRLELPGASVALALVLYGPARFVLESIRDDNPYEFANLTISQITGMAMFVAGVVLFIILPLVNPGVSSERSVISSDEA